MRLRDGYVNDVASSVQMSSDAASSSVHQRQQRPHGTGASSAEETASTCGYVMVT